MATLMLSACLQHLAAGLVEDLLPGPVTLLLLRRAGAPLAPELNPGVQAVGAWARCLRPLMSCRWWMAIVIWSFELGSMW